LRVVVPQPDISGINEYRPFEESVDIKPVLEIALQFDIATLVDELYIFRIGKAIVGTRPDRPRRKCTDAVASPGCKLFDVWQQDRVPIRVSAANGDAG